MKLGTRGSQLALWQARAVAFRLEAIGHAVDIVIIKTVGDRLQDAPLSEAGGKRLFVKDLEEALLDGRIDLAVHSAKDLPSSLPDGLAIAAALAREDPRDAIVLPAGRTEPGLAGVLQALRENGAARIGTSSVRREAQLAVQIPGASFQPVRGNVDTRLRKLDAGGFEALVLACAGLRRLGLEERISAALPVERCIPAPGQGIVVVETRAGDRRVVGAVEKIHDDAAGAALAAERAIVEALGGDCRLPLGALARLNGGGLEMDAIVCALDGSGAIRRHARGPLARPAAVGRRLADELLNAGAADLLDAVRRSIALRSEHTEGP